MASGVYAIPTIEYEHRSVVTNTTPIGAFRGAGRPEATQAIERAIDLFAAEIGLDPAEVRRANFIPTDAFPYTTADAARTTTAATTSVRSTSRSRRPATRNCARSSAGGGPKASTRSSGSASAPTSRSRTPGAEEEYGAVEITADGGAIVRTGSFSHGQGHETTFAMIVAERLGLPVESVTVVKGDTDVVPRAPARTARSRRRSAASPGRRPREGRRAGRGLAADLLEANPADVVLDLDTGRFHVVDAPDARVLVGGARGDGCATTAGSASSASSRTSRRTADVPVRRPCRRRRGRHGDRRGRARRGTSPSTTRG